MPSWYVSYRVDRQSVETARIFIVMAALPLCEVAVSLGEQCLAHMKLAPSQWVRRGDYEAAARQVLEQEFGHSRFDLQLCTYGDAIPAACRPLAGAAAAGE